jgi:hypothetical protein
VFYKWSSSCHANFLLLEKLYLIKMFCSSSPNFKFNFFSSTIQFHLFAFVQEMTSTNNTCS